MKLKLFLIAFLVIGLLAACGSDEEASEEQTDNNAAETEEEADAVSTASLVTEADAFVDATGEDGTWIIAPLNDLTIEEDVVVAGQFHDKDDPEADIYRKIAPYEQDEDHNITKSFTVTLPKMTVQSENLRIQGGTIAGDVYVEANGFNLHESATIDGNLYFVNEEAESSAAIDGEVTGTTELAAGDEADAVSTASLVTTGEEFSAAVGEDGTWIIAPLNDVTVEEELVVAGQFHDKDDPEADIYRKIAPYEQDEDRNITASFTIEVPKLTIESENTKIQGGTVKGDVVVDADGFVLDETATIDGNLTYANAEVEASATVAGEVTGEVVTE